MKAKEAVTVLVIDDDPAVRESIAAFLDKRNYRVILAGSGEEAVDYFHSACPDLVLCDVVMPGLSGLDTVKSILKQSPEQPIVLLAPAGSYKDVIRAMRLGVSDYVIKPIADFEMLELSIANNLKRARLVAENTSYRRKLELINRELEERVETFRSDQQAGRHVQMSILPESPQEICNYRFEHRIIPSLFLSGDSVDYKPISKSKVVFYIADVSGHGSSSAFVTVLLRFRIEQMRREYVRGRFSWHFSPAKILESLNKDLLDSGLDKYITLFMGVLDPSRSMLHYSVAGHYPLPVLYMNGGARFLPVTANTFPIGLVEDATYIAEQVKLDAPFSLTLFSDGILETQEIKNLDDKEDFLLRKISECGGAFDKLVRRLNLEHLTNVPDDITVMSITGQ